MFDNPHLFSPFLMYNENRELRVEETSFRQLADNHSTPLFIYSGKQIIYNLQNFKNAIKKYNFKNSLICYAMKANGNSAIVGMLGKLGCGTDIVSGGELYQSLHAGIPSKKIIFSGIGKNKNELEYAIDSDILLINVESATEVEKIVDIATKLEKKVSISIRLNPNIVAKTHPYIQTGTRESKFGVSLEEAMSLIIRHHQHKYIRIIGLGFHLGSQISDFSCFSQAIAKIHPFLQRVQSYISIKYFHVGGGVAIRYHPDDQTNNCLSEYLQNLQNIRNFLDKKTTIIFEPGRYLVGNAGFLLTKILYLKKTFHKSIIIVDAGIDNLMRPALYNGYHHIFPSCYEKEGDSEEKKYDIAGPICESSDYLASDRSLRLGNNLDGLLLVITCAGAYASCMSSNYNGRLRASEVFVFGKEHSLIKKRETYQDLIRHHMFLPKQMEQRCLEEGFSETNFI